MNTKNNQRFRENEERMRSVLLELMKTTDFEKITVKKICEKANVNRTTFYAHFIDIYDMLDKMETHLRSELLKSYKGKEAENRVVFSGASFYTFLQHIKKYQHFYKAALRTRRDFPLVQGYEALWDQIVRPQCEKAGVASESEMMYYFVYFQAGFTMILRRWVETGCKEKEEEIAAVIKNCIPVIWDSGKDTIGRGR